MLQLILIYWIETLCVIHIDCVEMCNALHNNPLKEGCTDPDCPRTGQPEDHVRPLSKAPNPYLLSCINEIYTRVALEKGVYQMTLM